MRILMAGLIILAGCAGRRVAAPAGPGYLEVRVTHWECKTGHEKGVVECLYVLEEGGVEYRRLRIVEGRK